MSHRANNPGWLIDGNRAFHGGMNASIPPSEIARNQVARAINCTMRGGEIGPRSGWVKRTLVFDPADAIETDFKTLRFQHSSFYSSAKSPGLISVQGGRFFFVSTEDFSVQEITPTIAGNLDINNPNKTLGWSVQADAYWIYQDNQSFAVIFNGSACRRAVPAQSEIPVGNVMAYAQGRIAVALPDRHSYRIGDLMFGPSGTDAANYRDSILKFTENNFLNEGGDFQARVFGAPSNDGPITAMKAISMADTQLGQGPLLVGTPYNVFTCQLPFDRTTWKDLANPQQTNIPIRGPLGQDSTVLVNEDLWYRSIDGVRSFIQARRDFSSYGNSPVSGEIKDLLSADTGTLLENGSAVLFDNRLMMTTSPTPSPHGIYHLGLAVMDFHMVSNLTMKLNPAWEGVWRDLRILKIQSGMVNGVDRCFAFALNCDNEIELWEMIPGAMFDETDTPISWEWDSPSYNFGNSDRFKRLETARIVLNEVAGSLTGTVLYRADASPCWNDWDTFSACAKREDCCSDQTTTTSAGAVVPANGQTVQITVATTAGMTLDNTALMFGGYELTLQSIDNDTTVTVLNESDTQAGGTIPSGTTVTFCGFSCVGPHTYRSQQRTPIRLHSPPENEDEVSGHFTNRGYEFQARVKITGAAKVKQVLMFSKDEPEMLGADRREEV